MTRSGRTSVRGHGERDLVRRTTLGGDEIAAGASIVPALEHWVSSASVRQAIGAWAYTLGAGERRPSNEAVRAAVGVASAIRELATDTARRRWIREGTETPDAPVPEEPSVLADRSGLAVGDVERALELLTAARVVIRQMGATVATVSVAPAVMTPAPAVARVEWSVARERLRAVDGSVASSLAVLRELAVLTGAFEPGAGAPSVRASVRDLESTTSFGRSTVSDALAALERARLLDVETRAGRTTRFALRRAAFGLPDEAPRASSVPVPTESASAPHSAHQASRATALASGLRRLGQDAPPGSASASVALIGTFAGTPIYAPRGTPLVLDRDADGLWLCRVGPLVLGPAEPE